MADDDKQPDARPKPQFGELAPEGWSWRPPADVERLDTTRPAVPTEPEQAPGWGGQAYQGAPTDRSDAGRAHPGVPSGVGNAPGPSDQLRRAAPRWNLGWSIGLLVVGFFGMSYSIGVLNAFPLTLELLHTNADLTPYTPDASVSGILVAGTVIMAVIWVASAAITTLLLVRRRLAFYVPLLAGVIAIIALIVICSIVLSSDAALLDFYSGVAPTGTPTP